MSKFFRRLFDMSTVDWVVNKNRKPTENDLYLNVVFEGVNYRFTEHEVGKALKRAKKQPEDNYEVADFIN